jgi:formate dehydrogenase iron-sulfur subunit
MAKAILNDTTKCIGCRACQVACKSWNNLPGESTSFSETWSNPRHLDADNFNRLIFIEYPPPGKAAPGKVSWHFVSRRCMHCVTPACVSSCPVGALAKMDNGAVAYNDDLCIGCRYCMMACPFQIPKFEWSKAVPYIKKCTFCADRLEAGMEPSCTVTCPTGALVFDERDRLIQEARQRITNNPGKYYPEIYGENTAGGTSTLYLTALSFDQLGLQHQGFGTALGNYPHAYYGKDWMAGVPWVALAVGGLSVGLYYINRRRGEVAEHERKED